MASHEGPPPPYEVVDIKQSNNGFIIARKAIGSKPSRPNLRTTSSDHQQQDDGKVDVDRFESRDKEDAPPLPPRPDLTLNTTVSGPQLFLSPNSINTPGTTPTSSYFPSNPSSAVTPTSGTSPSAAFVKKAYQEARHFAGGLIRHPFESTKHYTVLRHSHGLVFFQGTSTTLAVSIFSDEPLPAERTIWLQSKGWGGNTGMRLKAFVGRNGDWHNVTPTMAVKAEQLKPSDERAWQRDIKNFQRKKATGRRENHILRETAVVRIPAEAGDGYFQLVLCLGEKKKVLCPSPVFRVLSTSTSPHSLRGASLSTLPIELGALALGTYARNTAGRVIGPVASVVQNRVQAYMPSFWTQEAANKLYEKSGAETMIRTAIVDANTRYEQGHDGYFPAVAGVDVSPEQGPQAPYPFQFKAHIDFERPNIEMSNLPIIHLTRVPEGSSGKLHGYYFGWVRYSSRDKTSEPQDWLQAIISSLPPSTSQLALATITSASKRLLSIHLIRDSTDPFPSLSSLEVRILGFIRPDEPSQRAKLQEGLQAGDDAALEAAMLTEFDDVSRAQSILDMPAWGPDARSEKIERPWNLERVKTGVADTRLAAQRQVESIPLYRVGVRTPLDGGRERAVGVNGFFVVR